MRQLPKCINGSSVSVVKAASVSVSMCACKSSSHDMHKSVFWARCATARSVSVEKVSPEMLTRPRRSESERLWRQPEACGQTSSSAAEATP